MEFKLNEDLKLYNANVRGKSVGDCVKRAISMAFDVPYTQVEKDLNYFVKQDGRDSAVYNIPRVYDKVIQKYSYDYQKIRVSNFMTVTDFCEQHPNGSYILLVDSKYNSVGDHLVCVLNGDVWDSWDSRNSKVICYYVCDVVDPETGEVTNINREFTSLEDNLDEYYAYIQDNIFKVFNKLVPKTSSGLPYAELYQHPHETDNKWGDYYFSKYHIVSPNFIIKMSDSKIGNWKVVDVPLTPTTKPEEVWAIIDNSIKRAVTNLLRPVKDILKNHSADSVSLELYNKAGYTDSPSEIWTVNSYEKTLYKWIVSQLPELKYFVKSMNIQSPGEYSDSVEVKILALPDDPRFDSSKINNKSTVYIGNPNIIVFTHYDISAVKSMLKRYVKTYQRPYDDYDEYEEY